MRVSDLLQNPEAYAGKEVEIEGVVHTLHKRKGEEINYITDYLMGSLEDLSDETLVWEWHPPRSKLNETQENQLYQQLKKLLIENVSLGNAKQVKKVHRHRSTLPHRAMSGIKDETTLHYGNLEDHLRRYWHYNRLKNLAYAIDKDDDSWKTMDNSFIDDDIEAQLLDLYKRLTYERPYWNTSDIRAITYNSLFNRWLTSKITGVVELAEDGIRLKDVWKAVILAGGQTIHIITTDHLMYFDNFEDNYCVPVKQILQSPEEYYGKQITVRGLFTNDLVDYGDGIRYARIVPNRLYYEYRSKWDHRVSLHLKLSSVTGHLSIDPVVPGAIQPLSPNRGCKDIRITATLYPPESEHSTIILDDITDLVSVKNSLIYHWQYFDIYDNHRVWNTIDDREL